MYIYIYVYCYGPETSRPTGAEAIESWSFLIGWWVTLESYDWPDSSPPSRTPGKNHQFVS